MCPIINSFYSLLHVLQLSYFVSSISLWNALPYTLMTLEPLNFLVKSTCIIMINCIHAIFSFWVPFSYTSFMLLGNSTWYCSWCLYYKKKRLKKSLNFIHVFGLWTLVVYGYAFLGNNMTAHSPQKPIMMGELATVAPTPLILFVQACCTLPLFLLPLKGGGSGYIGGSGYSH